MLFMYVGSGDVFQERGINGRQNVVLLLKVRKDAYVGLWRGTVYIVVEDFVSEEVHVFNSYD